MSLEVDSLKWAQYLAWIDGEPKTKDPGNRDLYNRSLRSKFLTTDTVCWRLTKSGLDFIEQESDSLWHAVMLERQAEATEIEQDQAAEKQLEELGQFVARAKRNAVFGSW